jgi:hypothetical protein
MFLKGKFVLGRLPGVEDIGTILLTNDAKPNSLRSVAKFYLATLYDQLLGGCFLVVGDTIECFSCTQYYINMNQLTSLIKFVIREFERVKYYESYSPNI